MGDFIGAVDQGTTSTRFIVFDHDGRPVAKHQLEHEQLLPRAGWVEHNPHRDLGPHPDRHRQRAGAGRHRQLRPRRHRRDQPARDGDRLGPPHRAPVPQRHRLAGHPHRLDRQGAGCATGAATSSGTRRGCRRPPTSRPARCSGCSSTSTGLRAAAERGDALFGTPDTWVVWNLTGGPDGGVHTTDVTNASRTMLMDLTTLDWDDELLGFFGIPRAMLPTHQLEQRRHRVRHDDGPARRVRRCRSPACSATSRRPPSGRSASSPARPRTPTAPATSCCSTPARSWSAAANGLLTTVAYRFGDAKPVYALEGSIAVTGSAGAVAARPARHHLRRLRGRDARGLRRRHRRASTSCRRSAGCSPPTGAATRAGAIVGLSRFNTNAHLARATLEAICYQSRDVVDAMAADSGVAAHLPEGRRRHHREPAVHAAAGRRARACR